MLFKKICDIAHGANLSFLIFFYKNTAIIVFFIEIVSKIFINLFYFFYYRATLDCFEPLWLYNTIPLDFFDLKSSKDTIDLCMMMERGERLSIRTPAPSGALAPPGDTGGAVSVGMPTSSGPDTEGLGSKEQETPSGARSGACPPLPSTPGLQFLEQPRLPGPYLVPEDQLKIPQAEKGVVQRGAAALAPADISKPADTNKIPLHRGGVSSSSSQALVAPKTDPDAGQKKMEEDHHSRSVGFKSKRQLKDD